MDYPKGLIEDYFRRYATKSDDYRWAVDYVDDLVRDDPGEALSLTIALVTASKSDLDLAISRRPDAPHWITAKLRLKTNLQIYEPAVIARLTAESR